MINNVSHIVRNAIVGEVKLYSVKTAKTLPRVNSFVKIEILENVKGNYKILIDGNLFQSKLPIKAKAGDVLFAQTISTNPLTLTLTDFFGGKAAEAGIVAAILAKFGLKKTAYAKKFVTFLLKSKKPITREKLKNVLDFMDNSGFTFDEIQFAFLAAYFWDDNGESATRKKSIYGKVFDITFNELAELIFKKIVRLSAENLENEFYETLKEKLIFDHEKFEERKTLNALFGKARNAIELAEYLERYVAKSFVIASAEREMLGLRELLIKYVLQKSLLNKYGIYADFAVTLAREGLHLWRYEYSKVENSKGEFVYRLETTVPLSSSETVSVKAFISDSKIQGEIKAGKKFDLKENITRLNETLARRFSAELNFRPYGEQYYSL